MAVPRNGGDMNPRFTGAKAIGAISTWALTHVFHRPAANFPGKIGLYVDPTLIANLRTRLREGSVVVVGTNGKTTVTNLLADSFEAAGKSVAMVKFLSEQAAPLPHTA